MDAYVRMLNDRKMLWTRIEFELRAQSDIRP
jgi:hypothetical protein